eukprot:Gb_08033 [translate_table: standard]
MEGMDEQLEFQKLGILLVQIANSESFQSCSEDEGWIAAEKRMMKMARKGGSIAMGRFLGLLRKPDLPEQVADVVAKAIALCCGPCAAPPALRTFIFSPSLSVKSIPASCCCRSILKQLDNEMDIKYLGGNNRDRIGRVVVLVSWKDVEVESPMSGKVRGSSLWEGTCSVGKGKPRKASNQWEGDSSVSRGEGDEKRWMWSSVLVLSVTTGDLNPGLVERRSSNQALRRSKIRRNT